MRALRRTVKNEPKHSELGQVRPNSIQRTVSSVHMCVYIALCTIIVAHNIAQNRPDRFPSYPPNNHHFSDDVYLREGGTSQKIEYSHMRLKCSSYSQIP